MFGSCFGTLPVSLVSVVFCFCFFVVVDVVVVVVVVLFTWGVILF